MDRNLYEEGNTIEPGVAWIDANDYTEANKDDGTSCSYTSCNDEGPVTALAKLNERTSGWTNIPEITYTVSGLGQDGTTRKYEDMTVTGRARLITYAEATASSIGCEYSVVGSCP